MKMRVAVGDAVTKLAPGASTEFAGVSNEELLEGTRRLVGKSNQLHAALLAHLGEVEARGLFRKCACTSLYTYCIYELRFSEDEAARRAAATKWVRKFPALLDAIANGELHLTGLLMLGPLLTDENIATVLARAKFRTKKEIGKLVRTLKPLPPVPDRVEPLGPELPRALRNPTWAEFVESLCPPIRELPAGKRPADWANDTSEDRVAPTDADDTDSAAPARVDNGATSPTQADDDRAESQRSPAAEEREHEQGAFAANARPEQLAPLTEPQLYLTQFTASEEHVRLIERESSAATRNRPGLGRATSASHAPAGRGVGEEAVRRSTCSTAVRS